MTSEDANQDREKSTGILIAALVLSLVSHSVLMFTLSRCAFHTFADSAARAPKWTRDVPTMHVTRHVGDPLSAENARGRPAAAPVAESMTERVARLAEAPAKVAENAAAAIPLSVTDKSLESPPEVKPQEIRPAEKIDVLAHLVASDEATPTPALVVDAPKTFAGAELLPLSAPAPVATPRGPAHTTAAADMVPAPPAAPPPAGLGSGKTSEDPFGFNNAAFAAMQGLHSAKPSGPVLPPELASLVMPSVDESVVDKEKKAVKQLRDEQPAMPFADKVNCDLAYWIDPEHDNFKYFRLRLSSNRNNPLDVVSKDVIYLLDASGSIANDRLKSCRKAVSEAIRTLNSDDRFNVVAFRDRFSYLFDSWRGVDARSVDAADKWLGDLTAHGRTDVFKTLRSVLAVPRSPSRPLIAVVVTDGDPTSGLTRSAEIISAFSQLNDGLVAVYMYGVKDTANAYLMDMLTHDSRGEWMKHDGMRWRAAAGIPEFVARFADPVLTDVSIAFAATARVDAYPRNPTHLYANGPIDIYGVCPASLDRLAFSIRGLNGARACQDVFSLAFDPKRQLDSKVRVEWARRRLYALVDQYSRRPDPALLRDIKLFSKHYGVAVPYETELKKDGGRK